MTDSYFWDILTEAVTHMINESDLPYHVCFELAEKFDELKAKNEKTGKM